MAPISSSHIDIYEDKQFLNLMMNTISELEKSFSKSNGEQAFSEDNCNLLPFKRDPVVFTIFLLLFLASNLFTFIMRIYKNSITSTNTNIIIIMNSYIYEFYNLIVASLVSNVSSRFCNKGCELVLHKNPNYSSCKNCSFSIF